MTIEAWLESRASISPTIETHESEGSPRRRSPESKSPSKPQILFYDAHYYASDDDFLLFSTVRKYFRSNALSMGDAELFELVQPAPLALEQHPTLENLAMIFTDVDESDSRWRVWARKYLKYFVAVYFVLSLLILKFAGIYCIKYSSNGFCVCRWILYVLFHVHGHHFICLSYNKDLSTCKGLLKLMTVIYFKDCDKNSTYHKEACILSIDTR
jgi:hypothetical protein